jgi:hypothetical protein
MEISIFRPGPPPRAGSPYASADRGLLPACGRRPVSGLGLPAARTGAARGSVRGQGQRSLSRQILHLAGRGGAAGPSPRVFLPGTRDVRSRRSMMRQALPSAVRNGRGGRSSSDRHPTSCRAARTGIFREAGQSGPASSEHPGCPDRHLAGIRAARTGFFRASWLPGPASAGLESCRACISQRRPPVFQPHGSPGQMPPLLPSRFSSGPACPTRALTGRLRMPAHPLRVPRP